MEFRQSLESLSHARAATADIRDELYRLRQKLARVRRDRDRFSREYNPASEADKRRLASYGARERELESAIKTASASLVKDEKSEDARLKDFLTFTDPRSNLLHLDDGIPILLLPLRLETRFKQVPLPGSAAGQSQLWIRIFPDDVAIDSFESILSEDEVRNAKSYWQSIWKAADIEAEQRGAWRSLVAGHGSGRAYWITKTYIPANIATRPLHKDADELILVIPTESPLTAGEKTSVQKYWKDFWRAAGDPVKLAKAYDDLVDALNDAGRAEQLVTDYVPFNVSDPPPAGTDYASAKVTVVFVEFPDTDALNLRLQSWSVPPMVHIMPERLVVQAFYQGAMELNIAGEPITSPLVVGPDPSAAEGEELDASGEDLKVGDAFKWMVDFDDAVARGMGFQIDLNEAQAQRGFDRLCVLGVRMSADPAKGQELLEQLFAHHQSSRKGLSILRQGTPTNNTENAASGYQWQEDADVSFDYYHAKAVPPQNQPAWAGRSDGHWLADCLGINHSAIESVQHFTATEQTDARAMNIALWPATLGYFMESMMAPVFDGDSIRQTRAFFTRYVSGRGFVPAIRIGDQPYGILPATTYSRMNWLRAIDVGLTHATGASTSVLNARFLLQLYRVLMEIDKTWASLSNRVSYVGKRGDAHQMLLDIVGLHANSVEVHSRYAQSLEHIHNYYNLIGLPLSRSKTFSPAKYTQSGLLLLQNLGYTAGPSDDVPEILTKFFFGGAERLTGRLVDDAPLSETAGLRIQATGDRNYIEWLIDAAGSSHEALRRQQGFTDDTPPTALLYLLLQHALDLMFIDTSLHLYERHGLMTHSDLLAARVEPRFIHIEGEADKGSRWRHLYSVEPVITGSTSVLIGDYIPTQIGSGAETADLEESLTALAHLKELPTARLERALIEHLDACAYRYDAWMLGLVSYQLHRMRHISDGSRAEVKRGIHLGAYGWLEEVRPKNALLRPVELEGELKTKLQRTGDATIMKDESNAGYLLAPSLNQSVTAAVLRNGYISNRFTPSAKPFSINLSSERVRLALNIIDGMRTGQGLAALLGYQLERGLHDRHDAEVDEFIYDLRLAFPLQANHMESTRTEDADGIDQIEARNVIDGLALIEHLEKTAVHSYPFDLDLPQASPAQQTAIDSEVQRIIYLNDAVADLATAEGVHQVVQGNFDRATAVFESYSKGQLPPVPDVIQTPRSGITITHRVGLQFRIGLSPADPQNRTPRSKAEPALNDWLRGMLPPMADIVCVVECIEDGVDKTGGAPVSASDLGLEPIDLLYMLHTGSDQAMSGLDDLVYRHVYNTYATRPDAAIRILYTHTVTNKMSFFQLASLLDSIRVLVLQSRPLHAADVRPPTEAKGSGDGLLFLDPQRVTLLTGELSAIVAPQPPGVTPLQKLIDVVTALVAAGDVDDMIDELDAAIGDFNGILASLGLFGLPQTGTGFLYDWRRRMFGVLLEEVEVLRARLQTRLDDFDQLMLQYPSKTTTQEKYALLEGAERLIVSARTIPLPPPDDYRDTLQTVRRPAFAAQLGRIQGLSGKTNLQDLFEGIAAEQGTLGNFDLVGIDITSERRQVQIFFDDLKAKAGQLQSDVMERLGDAEVLLGELDSTTIAAKQTVNVSSAIRRLLHDDFKVIPPFAPTTAQADEWMNAVNDSSSLLRYLETVKDLDFPIDDWFYGVARVREKMHNLESATLFLESRTSASIDLRPVQLPYRQHDYWIALSYPDKIQETGKPFEISEDKLLYTAIYTEPFDRARPQCGLLLDEWTEVIPVTDTTAGLAFHFDQPNTEPPQTLLLVTPSEFRGAWQWQDLTDTLREVLEMAKRRAVEPDQIDTTGYGAILPALVSAASALPVTSTLNLAKSNKYYTQVARDE